MSVKTIGLMIRVTEYLTGMDEDLTLSRLNVFLHIAKGKDVLVRDLVKATGLSQSTIVRIVAQLGNRPLRGKREGLGWVSAIEDPDDPRRIIINLTPKGRAVLKGLDGVLN